MEKVVVDQLAGRIFELLGERLNARGKTLDARFRNAGRQVPRRARAAVQTLIEAQKMAGDPNLALRLDPGAVSAAYDQAVKALREINPQAERARKRFNLAALVALQVILIAICFVFVMRWRGFL